MITLEIDRHTWARLGAYDNPQCVARRVNNVWYYFYRRRLQ